MALTVLDAGVVIALLDAHDAHHAAAAMALRTAAERGEDIILPASAYAEVLVAPYRRGKDSAGRVDAFVDALPMGVEPISRPIASRAAELRASHRSLRLPDALVIASALVLEAHRLITTDRGWPKLDVRVEVL